MSTETKRARRQKAHCATCNHASSFHSGGGECQAYGCTCDGWVAAGEDGE